MSTKEADRVKKKTFKPLQKYLRTIQIFQEHLATKCVYWNEPRKKIAVLKRKGFDFVFFKKFFDPHRVTSSLYKHKTSKKRYVFKRVYFHTSIKHCRSLCPDLAVTGSDCFHSHLITPPPTHTHQQWLFIEEYHHPAFLQKNSCSHQDCMLRTMSA